MNTKLITPIIILSVSPLFSGNVFAGTVSFSGCDVEKVSVPTNTGLQAVYVLRSGTDATITYTATTGATVTWQRYSNLGGGYAENVTGISHSGNTYSIAAGSADIGYIITEGTSSPVCFWVVNYANHAYDVNSLNVVDSDCDRVTLSTDKPVEAINYYTTTGRREEVDRGIVLTYNTLEYSSDDNVYNQVQSESTYSSLGTTFTAIAPLCDTQFTLKPDKFALKWGIGSEVQSQSLTATAVQATTSAVQADRSVDNEQKMETEGLGGSAPCEITFNATVTDAAIYRRWEISSTADFEDILLSYDQTEFSYTFTEAGTTYVRFTADNAAGTCAYEGEVYTIAIGDSRLECPNAFSPGTSEGVNDEWRVSYRSIISFDCHIFNRWGQQLAHLTDPSQGWDGRSGGKIVGPGVYFYVIKAKGSDGKDYNLSGDINIIGSRRDNNATTTE